MNDSPTVEMTEAEWALLPFWEGLHFDDQPGAQYRAEYKGQQYLVTVHAHAEGRGRYSMSERVVMK